MSNTTVSTILCMNKTEHRMQICLRNVRITCNAEHDLQHAGNLKTEKKNQLQWDQIPFSIRNPYATQGLSNHSTFNPI